MFRSTPSCSQEFRRGRAALLCGVAAFVLAQAGLDAALYARSALRDPEYGRRLESLHARLAERSPGRPLVLFLGSSRIACTIQPAVLPYAKQPRGGAGPVVFNYGICGAGPVAELLTLRRLLTDGVRPDSVVVEVWPAAMAVSGADQLAERFPRERLRWDDMEVVRDYSPAAESERRRWCEDLAVPWLSLRTRLLNQWAPAWVRPDERLGLEFDGLDGWGWLDVPLYRTNEGRRRFVEKHGPEYITNCDAFAPSDGSRRAYAELLGLCRRENIIPVLLATPDPYLPQIAPDARRHMDEFLIGLSAANGAALIDARGWFAEDDFHDNCHLTLTGSAAFTERLDREVLRPYFAGEPLTRRWPPGRLNAAPAAPEPAGGRDP